MKFRSYARCIAPGLYLVRLTWRGLWTGDTYTDSGVLAGAESRAEAFDIVRRSSLILGDIAPLYGGSE